LRVQVPADAESPGPHPIEFIVESTDDPKLVRREKSTFVLPR
jgi:hypothetical protein